MVDWPYVWLQTIVAFEIGLLIGLIWSNRKKGQK
jgi:hypothetical protein